MNTFFNKDSWLVGIVLGMGSELVTGLVLWGVLVLLGLSIYEHLSWFGIVFLPVLIILRQNAKSASRVNITKSLITVLFVTFVIYLYVLYATKSALVTQPF